MLQYLAHFKGFKVALQRTGGDSVQGRHSGCSAAVYSLKVVVAYCTGYEWKVARVLLHEVEKKVSARRAAGCGRCGGGKYRAYE